MSRLPSVKSSNRKTNFSNSQHRRNDGCFKQIGLLHYIRLGNAFYQVELNEQSKKKTAFSTKNEQYCFNRMPFGIAAAPATFQKLMNKVLGPLNWKEAIVYLDDILIFSSTIKEHIKRVRNVLERIKEAGLKLNRDMSLFENRN